MTYFPSWRYHRTLPPCVVQSEAEAEQLGEGWADSPVFAEPENSEPYEGGALILEPFVPAEREGGTLEIEKPKKPKKAKKGE